MTKEFYTCFLGYISSKELKKLYANLCKQKLSVNGFPPHKTPPPAKYLASQIVKSEKVFLDTLEKEYIPNFTNRDDAVKSFTPDSAVMCLAYFVKSELTDEDFLMPLMEKKDVIQKEISLPLETGKVKKKAEEFREKYLSTRRELQQVKEDYVKLQTENISLKKQLQEKINELDLTKETLQCLEEKSSFTIKQLKTLINELRKEILGYQSISTTNSVSILLIMDLDETNELGVDILTYENISKLFKIANRYDEILLVINDLPFAAKRKIYKINALQEKLVTFSTKQEMLEYVKQRRNS